MIRSFASSLAMFAAEISAKVPLPEVPCYTPSTSISSIYMGGNAIRSGLST
jgi:hypothetical protein